MTISQAAVDDSRIERRCQGRAQVWHLLPLKGQFFRAFKEADEVFGETRRLCERRRTKEGLDVLVPIYDYAKERGFSTHAESILIEGFPVRFIPAYNDLVREAVENAATLKYRDVEAKVVTAEYLAAIALQTGRAKDRESVIRLLDEAVIDRAVLGRILESFGLADKFKKFEKLFDEE